jgi:hypothetical protein
MFRRDVRFSVRDRFTVLLLIEYSVNEDTCYDTKDDADADGDKSKSRLRDAEMIGRTLEDVRYGSEEEKEYTKGKRCVD